MQPKPENNTQAPDTGKIDAQIEAIKEAKAEIAQEEYSSKTKRNECANSSCSNPRRDASKYCQKCSDKHNKR